MSSPLVARVRSWVLAHPRLHQAAVPLIRILRPGRPDLLPLTRGGQVEAVPILLPSGGGFRMAFHQGADQIAAVHLTSGWGVYEAPLPTVFLACAAESSGRVLDVGANTGFYTLLALSANPGLVADAFEPNPPVARVLEENLILNDLSGRARLLPQAVSDQPGLTTLYLPTDEHGLIETSASLNPEFKERHMGRLEIAAVTLDDHVGSGGPPVAMLKVDVESFEHHVLMGATSLLKSDRPLVFLEVLPGADIEALETVRASLDYIDVPLRPGLAEPAERIGFHPEAWNHVLIPRELSDRWLPVVAQAAGSPAADRITELEAAPEPSAK